MSRVEKDIICNLKVEDEEDESTKANPKSNDLTQVVANPLGHSADDHHHLPAVAQPLLPSPTTLKPNKADKARYTFAFSLCILGVPKLL